MTRTRTRLLATVLLVLAVPGLVGCGSDDPVYDLRDGASADGEADYRYVIPLGSGELIEAGEPVAIIPNRLDVVVGETIEIVNEDDRNHLVGPYFVGAGETMRQRFSSVGRLEGVCTVHPDGEIVVNISEA